MVPLTLTSNPIKAKQYYMDLEYLDALDAASSIVEHSTLAEFVRSHALTLIKPDALAFRSATRYLTMLRERGFRIVAVRRVTLDRNATALLWRYRIDATRLDRLYFINRLNALSDAVLLILLDERWASAGGNYWACNRLSSEKGPANPSERCLGHIRSNLGCPSSLLSSIHTSDEPADLLRELVILLDRSGLARVVQEATAPDGAGADLACRRANQMIEELSATTRQVNLDAAAAAYNILCAIENFRNVSDAHRSMLHGLIRGASKCCLKDWWRCFERFQRIGAVIDGWDEVVIASDIVDLD
jgi:nucleoside diphosphate kinase